MLESRARHSGIRKSHSLDRKSRFEVRVLRKSQCENRLCYLIFIKLYVFAKNEASKLQARFLKIGIRNSKSDVWKTTSKFKVSFLNELKIEPRNSVLDKKENRRSKIESLWRKSRFETRLSLKTNSKFDVWRNTNTFFAKQHRGQHRWPLRQLRRGLPRLAALIRSTEQPTTT